MEGDPENSDEDCQGTTVLWEKCIQQSIIVDLSEDESLHLSDLDGSMALHVSQTESAASETSLHLGGSAELSGLDDSSSSGSSDVTSLSDRLVETRTKTSATHMSPQRPNTMQDDPSLKVDDDDLAQNTSDEEQEDLPYDGDFGSPYFNQTCSPEGNTSPDRRENVNGSPDGPALLELSLKSEGDLVDGSAETALSQDHSEINASKPDHLTASNLHPEPADFNQLLTQHFPQLEMIFPGRMIDAESLPEVSLLESMDDTLLSLALTRSTKKQRENHVLSGSESCSGRTEDQSQAVLDHISLHDEDETKVDITSAADSVASSTVLKQSSAQNSTVELIKQDKSEVHDQIQRIPPLVRTRSLSEMKYGQGQVHYPLPDFSKVAPKVKIPKVPTGPTKPAPATQNVSTMHRTQSSPDMLDVVSRVLEDSVQLLERPYVFGDEESQTPGALVHHLQAEYDKLLTKYAEAENLIDQMRLGTNTQPSSDVKLFSDCGSHDGEGNSAEGSHLGSLPPHLPASEVNGLNGITAPRCETTNEAPLRLPQPEEGPSEGDRMTAELRDIMKPFTQKVEEFRVGVNNKTISTGEQQMILRSMMEAQDQLERNYMSKKEEHRALEMQNYMGLTRNTGTFDPNRLMEGDIFRIGMLLDNVKEMIDRNMCELMSPPLSSSTPTPTQEIEVVRLCPFSTQTPSPPPSFHQGTCAGFSDLNCETETQEVNVTAEDVEEDSELHGGGAVEQRRESANNTTHYNGCHLGSPRASLERLDIEITKDEEDHEEESGSASTKEGVHRDTSACVSRTSLSSRQSDWTYESHSPVVPAAGPQGECDLGDCVSLAVEVSSYSEVPQLSDTHSHSQPPLNNTCASQMIVIPETDSGFGSSYLNQSGSGVSQPNLTAESSAAPSQIDLSDSDRESSSSNLQTALHSAPVDTQQWVSSHTLVQTQSCGAVELWVESTTKEASLRLQGSDPALPAQIHHHVSEPLLHTNMESEERGSQACSCSCSNREALLALKSEVFRLKKDLEEGLVQLPQLAQKMDYLTAKYRQDRQARKSKTRSRTHNRPSRQSPSRVDDWISSDMDLSRSKDTNSDYTAASDVLSQYYSSPAGSRRGSSVHLGQRTLQSSREGKSSAKSSGLSCSSFNGGKRDISEPQSFVESFYSKESWSPFSSPSLQKPLLQVNYCSSSSLPARFKVREPQLDSLIHHRKRSTQSDTALLPSDVYFQRTLSPETVFSKSVSRKPRRRGSKEEDMYRTLDEAIEVARCMKRTTDHMAKSLSADLAKAQLYRKQYGSQPVGDRKYHAL